MRVLAPLLAVLILYPASLVAQVIDPGWFLTHNTTYGSDGEVIFTDPSKELGRMRSQTFCASAYRVSFSAHFGDKTGEYQGGSINFYEVRYGDDTGYIRHQIIMDTYKNLYFPNYSTNPNDRLYEPFQPNDNHIRMGSKSSEINRWGGLVEDRDYLGPVVTESPPFSLKGAGWVTVTILRDGEHMQIFVQKGSEVFKMEHHEAHTTPGETKELIILGLNNSHYNNPHLSREDAWTDHKVRDVSVEITKRDLLCEGTQLSEEEIRGELADSCGEYSECNFDAEALRFCVDDTLASLGKDKVTEDQKRLLDNEIESIIGYCNGQLDCADVDEGAIRDEAYSAGFTDGVDSVDTDSHYQSGYDSGHEDGFSAGVNSVNTDSFFQDGFAEGKASCKEEQESKKVNICHRGRKTLSISVNALPAHLKHGDSFGKCPKASATSKKGKQSKKGKKKAMKNKKSKR